jgi:uncharacterized protein YbaP (TraB family)
MSAKRLSGLLAALLLLAGCDGAPPAPKYPPRPALWQVTGPAGETGWLFGTVHALPKGYDWRTARLDKALAASGSLVLEIADIDDKAGIALVFRGLSQSPGLPPLSARIAPRQRKELVRLLDKAGMDEGDFTTTETWAAALMLAQAAGGEDSSDGVESRLAKLARGKPVVELEGVRAQLGMFDALPEKEQRDLLAAVLADADTAADDSRRLADEWRSGRLEAIATQTREGLLADPELRRMLLVDRNLAWVGTVEGLLKAGRRPFVAVGAAHVAGGDGLPALLARRGWSVQRIQ